MASGLRAGRVPGLRTWPWTLAVLPALVFAVHGPALRAYFEADDFLWLIHDRWQDGWHAITGNWGLGTAYRPLTRLSFLADARMFGWHAGLWHMENLVLHAVDAGLLAVLARRAGARPGDAVLAGAVFVVLPLDWENVDWISGRTGLLCLGFMLGATVFWLRFVRDGASLWSACACQAGALLCYEAAAVLPLALTVLAPLAAGTAPMRRRCAGAVAALGGVVACIWLVRWMLLGSVGVATDVAGARYGPTLARDLLGVAAHLWRDLGPVGFGGMALALAVGLAARGSRLTVACLLCCGGVLYLPFTPIAGVTERFLYLATAPLAGALVASSCSWRGGRATLWLLVVVFGLRSHAQAEGFRHAGDVTRTMLHSIAALPPDGRNLVFDGVPTHDGPYYLLWANFEDAAAAVRRPGPGFAATSEWVLRMPDLVRRAMTQDTAFLAYDPAGGGFVTLSRADWRRRHGL